MRRISLFLLFVAIIGFVFSCKKNDDNFVPDAKYSYFPTDTGHYVIYDVDSVVYDPFYDSSDVRHIDSVHFQLKEVCESVFNDNSGRPTVRLERYIRADSTAEWSIQQVWTANRTTTTAEKYEDNLRFIKLVFPPNTTTTWKGNSYITITTPIDWMKDWDYQVTKLDVPYTGNSLNYDSTLTVLQHDEENLIEKKFGEEVYAKNVGLVSKTTIHLKKKVASTFPQGSTEGFVYTMRARSYGKE